MNDLITSVSVFRYRNFAYFWLGRLFSTIATQTQGVTLGWQVYSIARLTQGVEESAFLVGMVGLVQFLPLFALTLIAGEAADRHDRRRIVLICSAIEILCATGLSMISLSAAPSLILVFLMASLFGVVRAFIMPATTAMGPMLVPGNILPRAIAWNSFSIQAGMVLGPIVGGILCAISSSLSYAIASILFLASTAAYLLITCNTKPQKVGNARVTMIREGLNYIFANKVIFGAISLDLFAVLLGGVTALLPVYARDILSIGPDGFGLLRSSPAIGGAIMAIVLSLRPIRRHAGPWMLGAVAVFGLATIVFAVTRNLQLSVLALVILGAADVISVFVRQSLVQIVTPNNMRGRISSVSGLFISASNELGEFESGVAARFLGPVGAAIFGGVGSIIVMILWSKFFPALRKADRLEIP